MRTAAILCCLLFSAGALSQADAPAMTDSGEVAMEEALRLIEDDSPAAARKMPRLIGNIEATLKLRPRDPDYLVLLAKAYSRMDAMFGMYRGIQLADEALKIQPRHVEALLYKAEQAARSTCSKCADDLIEEAKQAGAPESRLHVLRAGVYMMQSMNARANPGGADYESQTRNPWQRTIEEVAKAIPLERDPARKARLLGWLFDMHVQLGDAAKARAAAEQAIEAYPEGRDFIERYAGFLMHDGDVERAAELAGKVAYYNGHPRADETVALALYLKWAKAWDEAPGSKRTSQLYEVARKMHKDLHAIVHVASASEATAPVARALILSRKVDVRAGDYRDQDGDTTLGNIVLALSDQAMARRWGGAGPRPTEELSRLMTVLLDRGANPNAWVSRGKEPMLAAAARSGQVETVRTLLKAGARVNDRGARGTTALIAAAQSEDKDAAMKIGSLLLASGADVAAADAYRQTPLIAAARKGNGVLVAALLAHGANPRDQDENDYGALEHAAQAGDLVSVRSLLAANAPLREIVNGCGKTSALRLAEQSGHKEIARLLRSQSKEGI